VDPELVDGAPEGPRQESPGLVVPPVLAPDFEFLSPPTWRSANILDSVASRTWRGEGTGPRVARGAPHAAVSSCPRHSRYRLPHSSTNVSYCPTVPEPPHQTVLLIPTHGPQRTGLLLGLGELAADFTLWTPVNDISVLRDRVSLLLNPQRGFKLQTHLISVSLHHGQ
jgi:hypothetical protein